MNKVTDLFIFLALGLCINFANALPVDICKNQSDGTRLAHPVDCSKFVVCRQSQSERILTCPLGLHFNRFDSICDMKERAACDPKYDKRSFESVSDSTCSDCVDTPTPGGENNVSGSGKNVARFGDRAGPSTGPSGTTCVNSGKCIKQPDGAMFADPNTTGYIVCQCKCQIEMPCAPGTKFNEYLNTCDHINAGGAANDTNCVNHGKCAGQPNGAIFPNPNTKTGYLQCEGECEVEISCAPGTIFNETLATCVTTNGESGADICETSGIKCINPGKCAGKSDGTILLAENATSFRVCLCECELVRSCAPDTIFQESLNACVHVNDSASGENCGTSSVKCNNPGQCAGQPDGAIYANPNTITGYIECKCECELEKPCTADTEFNEALKFCVHVGAGGGFNGGDNSGDTSCSGAEVSTSGDKGSTSGSEGNGGPCGSGDSGDSKGSGDEDTTGSDCGAGEVKCNNPGQCVNQPDGAIFANPNTTTGYIECRCECELEKSCVRGAIFNEALKFCVHINGGGGLNGEDNSNNTSCSGEKGNTGDKHSTSGSEANGGPCGSGDSGDNEGSGDEGTVGSNCATGKVKCTDHGRCVNQPDGAIFANPNTTIGYIECRCECELEKPCIRGTIFNDALKLCVHINDGGGLNGEDSTGGTSCSGGKGSASGSETSGPCGGGDSGDANDSDCGTGKVKCNNPGKCASQPNGAIFTNPNTTTGYIECRCECELEKPCARSTIFNDALKFCVHVNGGGGLNGEDHSSGTSCSGGKGSNCIENGTGGKGSTSGCEANGEPCGSGDSGADEGSGDAGSEKGSSGTEIGGESSGCGLCKTPGKCIDKPDGTMFASVNSTGYIVCMCGCQIERSCSTGTIFNETLEICIRADCKDTDNSVNGSECSSSGGPDDTSNSGDTGGESNSGGGDQNGSDSEGDSSVGTTENSKAGIDEPSSGPSGTTCVNSGKCVQQPDGTMFRDPNSAGYIVCQRDCQIKMPCAPGTEFNDILKTCDHIKKNK